MNQARRFEAKPDKRRRQRRKERIIGWISYISIAVVIQCFFIVCVCGQRGSVEIGGEYLILPAAVIFKKQIISAVSAIDELIWGED